MTKQRILFFTLLLFSSCKDIKPKQVVVLKPDVEYLHDAEKKLTDVIITDIFSPPVASRVYVYPLLAAYEAGRFSSDVSRQPAAISKNTFPADSLKLIADSYSSITNQLKGFDKMPQPDSSKQYDFTVASIKAFCTVAPKVIFAVRDIADFETQTLNALKTRSTDEVFNRSVTFGQQVADVIIKRLSTDNYKETRGMSRFEVKNDIPGRWIPTPPDYADGIEPHWAEMKALVMDSAAQCCPAPPPSYSENKSSTFWKATQEVYDISKKMTDEQESIITFWDDNPFVSRHKGHLMFQDKKMTPGGHWLAIAQLFLKDKNADFPTALKTYALTSIAMYDAFISCFCEKYHSAVVRPETVISAKIDKQWHPNLVTPAFPSYTSGHSTVSASAAEVLTRLFGDNQKFTDTTEKEFGLPVRSFTSFRQAAREASISRVYAGIHYRFDCDKGNEQGTKVSVLIGEKLKF